MSSKFHLFFLTLCIVIFVIFTPFILLYANGYKYDREEKTFIKTGSLFIDSFPTGASVIINGQAQEGRYWLDFFSFFWRLFGSATYGGNTPTIINDILPGKYQIEIVKQGFQVWRKEATILPNLTTRFKKIQLFFEEPELQIIDQGEVSFFWPSPSKKKIIYGIKTGSIKLLENNEINLLIDNFNFSDPKDPIYDSDEKRLIFSAKSIGEKSKEYFLLDLKNGHLLNLSELIPSLRREGVKIKFDKDPQYLLIGLKGLLVRTDFSSKLREAIFKVNGELKDWLINGNEIEIIRQEKNDLFFEKFSLTKPDQPIFSLKLKGENYVFLSSPYFILLSNGESIIFVASNPSSSNEEPLIFELGGKKIVPFSKEELLYFNDYEIQILYAKQEALLSPWQREIITRLSEPLEGVEFYGDWLYYLSSNKIIALEVDLSSSKNQHLLFKAKEIKDFVAPISNIIYFIGQVNGKSGLFSLKIKP